MDRFTVALQRVVVPFSLCSVLLLSGAGCGHLGMLRRGEASELDRPSVGEQASVSEERAGSASEDGRGLVGRAVNGTWTGVKKVGSGVAYGGRTVGKWCAAGGRKVWQGMAWCCRPVVNAVASGGKKTGNVVVKSGRSVKDLSAAGWDKTRGGAEKAGGYLVGTGKRGATKVRDSAAKSGSAVAAASAEKAKQVRDDVAESKYGKQVQARVSKSRSVARTIRRGYLRNVRDDLMDCGSIAVGVVPPLVRGKQSSRVIGIASPAAGVYAQVTDFGHLGVLYKATGDLEWDRRGAGVMIDIRKKLGLGPFNRVYITQRPIKANAYKVPGSELDPWRRHMDAMRDPLFFCAAKTMIFEPQETTYYMVLRDSVTWHEWIRTVEALPRLPFGWQDWEFLSLEVAIPEPFFTHSGFYLRVGVDPSQVFDLLLSTFGYDFYDDAAYTLKGELKHTE